MYIQAKYIAHSVRANEEFDESCIHDQIVCLPRPTDSVCRCGVYSQYGDTNFVDFRSREIALPMNYIELVNKKMECFLFESWTICTKSNIETHPWFAVGSATKLFN